MGQPAETVAKEDLATPKKKRSREEEAGNLLKRTRSDQGIKPRHRGSGEQVLSSDSLHHSDDAVPDEDDEEVEEEDLEADVGENEEISSSSADLPGKAAAAGNSGRFLISPSTLVFFRVEAGNTISNWGAEDKEIGRKLVYFWRGTVEGNELCCSLEKPPNAKPFSISCFYWKKMDSYFFTGIDCIRLLETLTNTRYSLEQKNRIRRNLEGFHPLTVTANRESCDDIFQLIMSLMKPRPKNFDRGIKIFPWEVLHVAIIKIMTKYGSVEIASELHVVIKEETRMIRDKLPRQIQQLHLQENPRVLKSSSSHDLLVLPGSDAASKREKPLLPATQAPSKQGPTAPPPRTFSQSQSQVAPSISLPQPKPLPPTKQHDHTLEQNSAASALHSLLSSNAPALPPHHPLGPTAPASYSMFPPGGVFPHAFTTSSQPLFSSPPPPLTSRLPLFGGNFPPIHMVPPPTVHLPSSSAEQFGGLASPPRPAPKDGQVLPSFANFVDFSNQQSPGTMLLGTRFPLRPPSSEVSSDIVSAPHAKRGGDLN